MGHHISAIIGEKNINIDKLKEFVLAAAFEDNFVIILLDLYSMIELEEIYNKSTKSESKNLEWDCELTQFLAKKIGLEKFVLIKTDYFGGIGEQYATYYENGLKILTEVSINETLQKLGVERKNNLDEFDSLHLDDYRDSEYYYWENGNWADQKENMIAGRILKSDV